MSEQEKAKRARETGDLVWQMRRVEENLSDWSDMTDPKVTAFDTQATAEKWLKDNACNGDQYRLIRVYRVVTPKFETKTTVQF